MFGERAIESLLEARRRVGRFRSLAQVATEVDLRLANRKVWESLVKAGRGADQAFASPPPAGDVYRVELLFSFGDTEFETWDAYMEPAADSPYGWKMESAEPQ